MEDCYWYKVPEDIQTAILSRLNARKLIRLKLVCWGWYHVISCLCLPRLAPPSLESYFLGFIVRHFEPASPCKLELAVVRKTPKFKLPYNTIMDRLSDAYQPEDVQDCCNGILLVVHHDNEDIDGAVHYRVYNPTTGENIMVPQPPNNYYHSHHYTSDKCCFSSLAFDPTKSSHYKIICTRGGNITNPLKVETFSSQTGKWLAYVVNIDPKLDGVEWIYRSAYLDGRIYRLMKTNYLTCIDQGKGDQLLSVQAIELPNFRGEVVYNDENGRYGCIGISIGHLHYSTKDKNGSTLFVYMLKDDVSWLLKYSIPIEDLLPRPSSIFAAALKRIVNKYHKEAWFNFHAFHPNRDRLFIITPGWIIFYSPEEKFLVLCHIEGEETEIVVRQNYSCVHKYLY